MKAMRIEFDELFTGKDMRMANGAIEALDICLTNPERISELIELIRTGTPKHKMCAADALEKISAQSPQLLDRFNLELLEISKIETQQEVRWHIAQIAPRLTFGEIEAREWVAVFKSYLKDKSRIVVTFAMNAIWEISKKHNLPGAREIVEELATNGAPSVRVRARKILNSNKSRAYPISKPSHVRLSFRRLISPKPFFGD